jgi:Tol biopolymer transport system component
MKLIRCGVVTAIALVSIQCSDASAPEIEVDDPIINSPSGRIAFVTETSPGNGALYVANSDGSGLRQLHAGPTYYARPRWSPDRRRIAFSRFDLNTLVSGVYVIDVDGPDGIVRLADGSNPGWSPDGSKIVYVAGSFLNGGLAIHVMNADGSNVRRLTFPNNPAQCSQGSSANDLKPDWSPDGQKILFERDIHTSEDGGFDCGMDGWGYVPNVYVMNADGTGARRLRSLDLRIGDGDPAWSPDGRSIAFSTHYSGLYVIDKDALHPAEPLAVDLQGIGLSPVWSPDSKKLLVLSVVLSANPPNNRFVIVDLQSRTTQVLSFPTVTGAMLDPAWSR